MSAARAAALRVVLGASAIALAAGCQERLTAPADCPAQCPGGSAEVFDTTLTAVPGADSSYQGYVEGGSGIALLVSNGLPAIPDARAIYRFGQRPDSIAAGNDTNRSYVVDSVLISINLLARDTLLDGLKVFVYRIANTVQAGVTFADVEAQLVEPNLIDSVLVADTLNKGTVQIVLRGADVLKTGLPVDAGGTLAIGVAIAPAGTGIRIGSTGGGTGATFVSYVTANVADTVSDRKQAINRTPSFNTYVSATPLVPDPSLLTVGGTPSSRALVRFDLPDYLEDSANIVRATLELVPSGPIAGLRTDPSLLLAKAVLGDLGAKSPTVEDNDANFVTADTLSPGVSDTVRLDVTNIVKLWQSATTERPEAIFLKLLPEAATFMRPEFGSTRRPEIGAPRLRITYMRAFPFETP